MDKDLQQNYHIQKISHMSKVWKCVKWVIGSTSSEDEAVHAISHMQAARQGLHCFSWIETVMLLNDEGWLS